MGPKAKTRKHGTITSRKGDEHLDSRNLRITDRTMLKSLPARVWGGTSQHAMLGSGPSLPKAEEKNNVAVPVVRARGDKPPKKPREGGGEEGPSPRTKNPNRPPTDDRTLSEVGQRIPANVATQPARFIMRPKPG